MHAIISDECRRNRGDEGAIQEVFARLRKQYFANLKNPPGTRFHVVLTVERN